MKHLLLSLLGFGLAFVVHSQDYQTVNSSEVKLFEPDYGSIRGYRIDSVKVVDGDSLLYPSRSIQSTGEGWDCYNPHGASMLGDYVRILPIGENLFFNQNGDTIRIETQAQVDDSWVLWSGDDQSISAEIVNIISGNVFGVADSIKVIRLSAPGFDCNGDSLLLSKNYGLLSTFNFYAFPNFYEDYYSYSARLYALYGIESLDMGKDNLNTFAIYDFQPGDEIHIETKNLAYGEGSGSQIAEHYTSREENLPNSIVYGMQRTVILFNYSEGVPSVVSNNTYTTYRTITPTPGLDALPTLPVSDSYTDNAYAYFSMSEGEFVMKQDQSNMGGANGTIIGNLDNDCYEYAIYDGCTGGEIHSYYKGLGGPYYICYVGAPYINSVQLMYYKKDSVEWGTPFDLTVSVPETDRENGFEIFPNPASDKVNIQIEGNTQPVNLTIIDLSGREVMLSQLNSDQNQVDISELESGIYFIRLTLSTAVKASVRTENIFARKLVVE